MPSGPAPACELPPVAARKYRRDHGKAFWATTIPRAESNRCPHSRQSGVGSTGWQWNDAAAPRHPAHPRSRAPGAFSAAEIFTARLRNRRKSVTSAVQMTLQTLEKSAMELPEDQRVTLAHRILKSTEPPKDPEIQALWEMEIARRIELLDNGGTGRHPAAEVFHALDQRLRP